MDYINFDDWLLAENPMNMVPPPGGTPGGPGDPMGMGMTQAGPGMGPSGEPPQQAPEAGNPQDISDDPEAPDMPEDGLKQEEDFEVWKNQYHKESVKGNVTALLDMINRVRDRDLEPIDRKFVEDNLQIQYLRGMSNVLEASKKIRRSINDELDRNNPSTTVVKHMFDALQEQPLLSQQYIKLSGYYALKGELHRKFVAALTGAVQVSSGAEREDLIIWDNEFSIMLSTRMNARFGDINLGRWSLQKDDPNQFLSDPEREKLETGSPEEREALRHRVIMESIFNRFKTRGFLITVVSNDGTVYLIGWDLSTSLKAAYLDGKLVVRTKASENSEVMLDEQGNITAYLDLDVLYSRETGEVDAGGKPIAKSVRFLERREGMLFLVAPMDVLKEASTTIPGLAFLELPFTGNPSDLQGLSRATYTVDQLLARQP